MAKKAKKRTKRIKNLIVVCTLSSMVFIVATFAWFIGMRTVNVSSFDVSIATTDSLLLSLDGRNGILLLQLTVQTSMILT